MSYKILSIAHFDKQFKRLLKKFPSLKSELSTLVTELTLEPTIGASLGNDCYKIRLAVASKGKGKSGVRELLPILLLPIIQYSCYQYMINLSNQILMTRN